jgi:SNF2 family DNA or RNA helicase
MMQIDYSDNNLYINSYNSELEPYHKLQLKHYGFIDNSKDSLCLSNNIENVLIKTIDYFGIENIVFSLSNSCKSIFEDIEREKRIYNDILLVGKRIKNSDFDEDDFYQFKKFIKCHIPRKLKDHQEKAAYHFYSLGNGANFSVPGAGKTTVVLTVYEKLKLEGKVNKIFVVGPAACFGPWKDEFFEVLGRKPEYCILAGGDITERKSEYYSRDETIELYLTTFNTLSNDQEDVCKFLNGQGVNALLVIDEAHYIKRIQGEWANAALNVGKYSKFKCILTGTPIPKNYSDLYNLFEFLWPEKKPITSENKIKLSVCEQSEDFQSAKNILDKVVGPLYYRVNKNELDLKPQIFNSPIRILMNPKEQIVYNAIKNNILDFSSKDYLNNFEVVNSLRKGRMIRMRQCLSYTKLLRNAIEGYEEDLVNNSELGEIITNYDDYELPAKLEKLILIVKEFQIRNEKVVIWAHFIETIKLIEKQFKLNGFKCKKIIGETPSERSTVSEEETREKIRNEFVSCDSGLDILLANPAACAESISLHKTCYNAIYYDLSYNGAQYLQSLDRIHRVGGSEEQESYYHFLHYENTIEPDILSNLESKKHKMLNIIETNYNICSLDMFEENDDLELYETLFTE